MVGRTPQHAVSKYRSSISPKSSLQQLAGLPCRLIKVVTREVHRLSLIRLIYPVQDHFIFLTLMIISRYDFFPLPDPDVGRAIFVCDVEHKFDLRLTNDCFLPITLNSVITTCGM